MTQIGLAAFVNPEANGAEVCAFCGKQHQDKKPTEDTNLIPRQMDTLKKGGRTAPTYTGEYDYRAERYVGGYAPLLDWNGSSNQHMELGFKGAAHHCLPLSVVNNVSKDPDQKKRYFFSEIKAAGYSPNRGENNIYLPLSRTQFIRARALHEVANGATEPRDAEGQPPQKKRKAVIVPDEAYGRDLRHQKHRGGHTDVYFDYCATLLNTEVKNRVAQDFCGKKRLEKEDLIELLTELEDMIWEGLTARLIFDKYKLYNNSYLDPYQPWGAYEEEQESGQPISALRYLDITIAEADAEAESKQAEVEQQPPTID